MSWATSAMTSTAMRSSAVIDFAAGVLDRYPAPAVVSGMLTNYDPTTLTSSDKQSIIDYIFYIRKGMPRNQDQWQYICQNIDISLLEICRYYLSSSGFLPYKDGMWTDLTSDDGTEEKKNAQMRIYACMQAFIKALRDGVYTWIITPPRVLMTKYQFGRPFNSKMIDSQMTLLNNRFVIPLDISGMEGPPGPREAHKHHTSGWGPRHTPQ